MTDPGRETDPIRGNVRVWILVTVMALIAVGGLAYGLSYPWLQAGNLPHNFGPMASHIRSDRPL